MTLVMRKPILVAGIGLSVVLWGWQSLHQNFSEMGEWGLWMAIALGSGFWWLRPKSDQSEILKPVSPITQDKVTKAIEKAQKTLDILAKEAPDFDITPLQSQLDVLPQGGEDYPVTLAIAGGKNTGKSTLKNQLDTHNLGENVQVIDTEALFTELNQTGFDNLQIADLVIFLTNGDLTETEWQALQQFHVNYQQPLLLFNKQDCHIPEDRALIVQMLRKRVDSILSEAEVIPVALNPSPITVRRYDSEGQMTEALEQQEPDLNHLIATLTTILKENRSDLLLGRVWRAANQLQHQAKNQLNHLRREKALPIIENYQWIAGTMAIANPLPSLDLLATAAINGQMIMDLGKVYHQSFSLSQAQTVSGEIAKLMLKLGLVEFSTQTIGSLLKSHTMTYLAGGVIQGISAAYLTRIAALSLIEYFQEQELSVETDGKFNLQRLKENLQQIFNENQRMAFLRGFVSQALGKIAPSALN